MITVYNAKNLAQQWFFKRAYDHLERAGLLSEASQNDNKTFLSLEGYFANIGNLIQLRTEYAMIPSDEEPFEINANTRLIKIPAAFAKGVAITGDDMSEVITFTVDRYFDYVDLAGTDICVQWDLPGEDGGTGISHITMIDLETIPGKIRFGWPLTEKLTQFAGKVSFAIKFFIANREDPSKHDYVLNTLPAVITILPGLNVINPSFSETNIDGEFLKFVKNSDNPGLPPAPSPKWTDYREGGIGKDLKLDSPAKIDLDSDSLTLTAQAQVTDNGYIKYSWYFKQEGLDSDYPAVLITEEDDRFIVSNYDYKPVIVPADGKRAINEQYYVKVAGAEADAYELYVGDTLDPEGEYFERFTSLTIKARNEEDMNDEYYQNITGAYWVSAENFTGTTKIELDPERPELGEIPAMNYSTPAESHPCIVPTPQPVDITSEPKETVFIESPVVTLKVETSVDNGDPHRTYVWYRNELTPDMKFEDANKISEEMVLNLQDDTLVPGWYYVDINSQLNRAVKNAKSSHPYRVVNNPIKPSLKLEYCNWTSVKDADEDIKNEFFANTANWHDVDEKPDGMASDVAGAVGDRIRLRVNASLGENPVDIFYPDGKLINNLHTDGISYKWHIIPVDADSSENVEGEGILLTPENISDYSDVDGNNYVVFNCPIDANYLDVICRVNNQQITSYYCEVTNTLDTKSETFKLADYKHIFNIW